MLTLTSPSPKLDRITYQIITDDIDSQVNRTYLDFSGIPNLYLFNSLANNYRDPIVISTHCVVIAFAVNDTSRMLLSQYFDIIINFILFYYYYCFVIVFSL